MNKIIAIYLLGFMVLGLLITSNASGGESGPDTSQNNREKATFAGGCFWCMQPPFDKLAGVRSTTVGYCGGKEENPDYKQVSAGKTGHAEAVEIEYDPARISYAQLLDVFWRNIDPTQKDGQFNDLGQQYRTAIFYHNEEQRRLAEASKEELGKSGRFAKEIVTEIVPATTVYRLRSTTRIITRRSPCPINSTDMVPAGIAIW